MGDTFTRDGTRWIVTRDEGRSRFSDHVVRLICEPIDCDFQEGSGDRPGDALRVVFAESAVDAVEHRP